MVFRRGVVIWKDIPSGDAFPVIGSSGHLGIERAFNYAILCKSTGKKETAGSNDLGFVAERMKKRGEVQPRTSRPELTEPARTSVIIWLGSADALAKTPVAYPGLYAI